jgi:NAD(P) transhydrogenase
MLKYDLLVIGSGPAGEKAAVQAAKLRKTVAIVEKGWLVGGVSLHTGTLPSKTLRETVLYYSRLKQRSVYGIQTYLRQDISISELMYRKEQVVQSELDVIEGHLFRNNVEVIQGTATFVDPHTLDVELPDGRHAQFLADVIVIATGTRPRRPTEIPFDDSTIYDGETILSLNHIPRTMSVVGGGVIGCEYASIFANLGIKITLFDSRAHILENLDAELVEALQYQMRKTGVILHLNEKVEKVEIENENQVMIKCASGKVIRTEKLLYTVGRIGNTDRLNLEAVGLRPTERGYLPVNEYYQTAIPHIYAAGDVIGPPMLASISQDQGRLATLHAFGSQDSTTLNRLLPYALYTIPELSIVGETEESLTRKGVPYEIGHAFYREVSRGQIIGEPDGMIKLLFHRDSLELLGVHIIGNSASELIHIGQAVMSFGGKITFFIDTVFNYPTLCEAYKIAALNGINRLG